MASKTKRTHSTTLATTRRQAALAEAQVRKERASMELEGLRQIQNSYKGGVPTRTSELWTRGMGYQFGTSTERQQLVSSRDRAYQAARNNPVAKTLLQTETDNVIGDGLNYQPTTDSEEWNREAEDKYYDWLETASVRGGDIHTGCEIQRMIWERSRAAGDIGWILVARDFQGLIDSRIQIVPSENIQTPDGGYGTRNLIDGIQYDQWGRPTTFHVLSHSEQNAKRGFEAIPARDFVYLPHMTEPNQARGESCFITIFDLLAHLDRYVDGVSLAAWMATVFGIVFKQNNASKQLAALGTLTNSQGIQQKAVTFENGMVKYVGTDEEVAQVQAQQPMQQTSDFIRTMFRMLGTPFDMPLEVVYRDMSTCNFASARIGLLPFYRSCRIKAARFGSHWSRTIKWWLSRERFRTDDDPKKWTTAFPERFWSHELLPNAWDYTNPIDEPQADLLQIDMKTKSPQMVIAERGRDSAKILRELREWNEITKDLPQIRGQYTRDDPGEATPNGPDPELERIKGEADAYGVGVRAGVITPQTPDEESFRTRLKLPPMTDEATAAWEKDKGVRRPITLVQADGMRPAPGAQQQPSENGDTEDVERSNTNGNGSPANRGL